MEIIYLLLPISICLALIFVLGFIFSVKTGQYDDLDTPAYRVLIDEENDPKK